MEVIIFGIKLNIKPVAFTIPFIEWDVYWYGILIALGFLLALFYGFKNAKRFGIDPDRMVDVILMTVPVSILCARAYYVIFDPEGRISSFKEFFGFGTSSGLSGIAIYGAVIGAFLMGAIGCKIKKIKILDMFDLASIGFLIGQAIGRWGNFTNQEAFGNFTGSNWWGMESARTISYMKDYLTDRAVEQNPYADTSAITGEGLVHPCFLYESIWCIAGFFVLHHFSKKRKFSGQMVLMYCAWYGFGRLFIELLRTDSLRIGQFKVSVLVSFIICLASIVTLLVLIRKQKKVPETSYTSMFAENEEDYELSEVSETEEITEETEEVEND